MISLCPAFGWDSSERRVAALHQIKNSDEYYNNAFDSIGFLNAKYTIGINIGNLNSTFKSLGYIPLLNIIIGLGRIFYSTHGYIRESKNIDRINKNEVHDAFAKHQLKTATRVKQEYAEHIKRGIAECLLGPLLIVIDLVVTIWNDKIIKNYCKENNLQVNDLRFIFPKNHDKEEPSSLNTIVVPIIDEDLIAKADQKPLDPTLEEKPLKPSAPVEVISEPIQKTEIKPSDTLETVVLTQEEVVKADLKSPKFVEKTSLTTKPVEKEVWRQFLETEVSNQLKAIGRTFGHAEERGDCFFDAVAQQLNKLLGKSLTKRDIRNEISKHLQKVNKDPYSQEAVQYQALRGDEVSYEDFCSQVHKCLEDFEPGQGVPVWGDRATAQMIADIFNVEVHVYASEMQTITMAETFKGRPYEKFNYIPTKDMHGLPALEVCTLIETKEDMIIRFEPLEGAKKKGVLELANISRGPWGHWMPIDKLKKSK